MEVAYSWQIVEMKELPHLDGLTDVVFYINYSRKAETLASGSMYYASFSGEYICPAPSSSAFIPFNELTEPEVISWLDAGVDYPGIDAGLLVRLEEQIHPPVVNLGLPWETTTTTTTSTTTTTTTQEPLPPPVGRGSSYDL